MNQAWSGAIAWVVMAAALAAPVYAQSLPRILADPSTASAHYLPDFSYAGYGFGAEAVPTASGQVVSVSDYGAVANDERDDSAGVLAAIEAANAVQGPVIVRFPPGRFIITEILFIERGNIVVQGAGRGSAGTTLYFPRPLRIADRTHRLDELRAYLRELDKRQREPERNLDVIFSEYSWSGGFIWVGAPGGRPAPYLERFDRPERVLARANEGRRGERSLRVARSDRLRLGQIVRIDWNNRRGPNGPLLRELYGDAAEMAGSHHWTTPNRPLVRQSTQIVAIEGGLVTIADPLLHDISSAVPAQISEWTPLQQVGIEDLQFEFPHAANYGHHTEEGFNAIDFGGVFNGWVRNLRIVNADSGVLTYDSANVTLSDIETAGERSAHYAVHIGNVHNVLVERVLIRNRVIHPLTFNTQSTRSVYADSTVFQAPVLDQHAGANHQNLFDNITLFARARRDGEGVHYAAWNGSGAAYWEPGHGRFNTTWNLHIVFEDGAAPGETVTVQGLAEGPEARIIGLHANRPLTLDYRPEPYVESLNQPVENVPSLYAWQRARRLAAQRAEAPN